MNSNPNLEIVTEIGTFGSLNIADPTSIKVDKELEHGLVDKDIVEEDLDMDELAKKILPKYEEKLGSPDKGQSVDECFDLTTLRPKDHYLELYKRVRDELIDMGMPLNNVYGEYFCDLLEKNPNYSVPF